MRPPASTTSPRRRPTSRVSSTDAVLTEVVIACSPTRDGNEPAVDPHPDAGLPCQVPDDREVQPQALAEPSSRGLHHLARRRAHELVVFGFHQPACPCLLALAPNVLVHRDPT